MSYACCDLLQFVDGWELNGQFFPSPVDHPKPLNLRYYEFCGRQRVKQVLESSQNAALIQYMVPQRGKGFSFTVRFLKNSTRKSHCYLRMPRDSRMSLTTVGFSVGKWEYSETVHQLFIDFKKAYDQ
jgi:hypothetical protein